MGYLSKIRLKVGHGFVELYNRAGKLYLLLLEKVDQTIMDLTSTKLTS